GGERAAGLLERRALRSDARAPGRRIAAAPAERHGDRGDARAALLGAGGRAGPRGEAGLLHRPGGRGPERSGGGGLRRALAGDGGAPCKRFRGSAARRSAPRGEAVYRPRRARGRLHHTRGSPSAGPRARNRLGLRLPVGSSPIFSRDTSDLPPSHEHDAAESEQKDGRRFGNWSFDRTQRGVGTKAESISGDVAGGDEADRKRCIEVTRYDAVDERAFDSVFGARDVGRVAQKDRK